MDKRYLRLQRLKLENKILGKTKRTCCKKCGNNNYYVFYIESNNTNGIYCSKWGTWLKFESASKNNYKPI